MTNLIIETYQVDSDDLLILDAPLAGVVFRDSARAIRDDPARSNSPGVAQALVFERFSGDS